VRLSSTPIQGPPYYDGAYAPYGESYAEWGTTDHQFTGQREDTVGDLYDFPFREYHPTQGRWLSPDPLGGDVTNPQSLNRYAYVMNNPTSFVDPLGLLAALGTDPAGYPGLLDCPDDMDACSTIWLPMGGWGGESGGGGGGGGTTGPAAGGGASASAESLLPCLTDAEMQILQNYLLGQAAAALGTPVNKAPGVNVVTGGAMNVQLTFPNGQPPVDPNVLLNSQPLNNPILEPGWHNEIRIDNPVPSVPVGAGSSIHVLYNIGFQVGQGTDAIVAAKIHVDIGNPQDVVGLLRHVFGDLLAARIAQTIGGPNCAVKFGVF